MYLPCIIESFANKTQLVGQGLTKEDCRICRVFSGNEYPAAPVSISSYFATGLDDHETCPPHTKLNILPQRTVLRHCYFSRSPSGWKEGCDSLHSMLPKSSWWDMWVPDPTLKPSLLASWIASVSLMLPNAIARYRRANGTCGRREVAVLRTTGTISSIARCL